MKREIALLIGLLMTLCLFAQDGKTYSGRVTDASGNPLARVSVLLLNPKGNTVKFTRTDAQGKFSFFSDAALSYKTQKYELKVSCNNLLGTNKREYRSLSITGSSYSITELRPREVLASVIFNL